MIYILVEGNSELSANANGIMSDIFKYRLDYNVIYLNQALHIETFGSSSDNMYKVIIYDNGIIVVDDSKNNYKTYYLSYEDFEERNKSDLIFNRFNSEKNNDIIESLKEVYNIFSFRKVF